MLDTFGGISNFMKGGKVMILTVGERMIFDYLMENLNIPTYDCKLFAREYYRKGYTKEQSLEEYKIEYGDITNISSGFARKED